MLKKRRRWILWLFLLVTLVTVGAWLTDPGARVTILSWLGQHDRALRSAQRLDPDDYAGLRSEVVARAIEARVDSTVPYDWLLDGEVRAVRGLIDAFATSDTDAPMWGVLRVGELAIPQLEEALARPEPRVRLAVARTLCKLVPGHEGAVTAMIELAEVHQLRGGAMFALAEYASDSPATLARLTGLIGDELQRDEAIAALGWLGARARPAIDTVLAVLESHDSRRLALRLAALAQIGGLSPEQLRQVVSYCESHPRLLPGFNVPSRLGLLLGACGDVALPVVLTWIGAGDESLRQAACVALVELAPAAPERTIPALTEVLETPAAWSSAMALRALAAYGPAAAPAAPSIRRHLATGDETRILAVRALGAIGESDGATVAALLKAIDDRGEGLEAEAIRALAGLRPVTPAMLAGFAGRFRGTDERQRQLLLGLAALGPAASPLRGQVASFLLDVGPLSWAAAGALGAMSDPPVRAELVLQRLAADLPEAAATLEWMSFGKLLRAEQAGALHHGVDAGCELGPAAPELLARLADRNLDPEVREYLQAWVPVKSSIPVFAGSILFSARQMSDLRAEKHPLAALLDLGYLCIGTRNSAWLLVDLEDGSVHLVGRGDLQRGRILSDFAWLRPISRAELESEGRFLAHSLREFLAR